MWTWMWKTWSWCPKPWNDKRRQSHGRGTSSCCLLVETAVRAVRHRQTHAGPRHPKKENQTSEIIVEMEEDGKEEGTRYPRKELIFSSLPYAHALTLQVLIVEPFYWFSFSTHTKLLFIHMTGSYIWTFFLVFISNPQKMTLSHLRLVERCVRVASVPLIHSQSAQTVSPTTAQLNAGYYEGLQSALQSQVVSQRSSVGVNKTKWKLHSTPQYSRQTTCRSGDLMHTLSCPHPRLSLLPGQSQVCWQTKWIRSGNEPPVLEENPNSSPPTNNISSHACPVGKN